MGMHSAEPDTDSCPNCKTLQLELNRLKKLISPDDNKVPDGLWDLFPPKGQYLKNILLYSGYETYDAIMKLTDDAEMMEIFSFVRSLSDTMDEREKKELFGIFYKNPEKLTLLPGLKPVLARFVDSVRNLRTMPTVAETPVLKKEYNETPGSDEKYVANSIVPLMEVIDILAAKLCTWIRSHRNFQQNFTILKGNINKPDLIPESTFSLAPSTSPIGVIFTCEVCKTTVILQRKTTGSLILSNPHRHMSSRCWLRDDFAGKLPPRSPLFTPRITGFRRAKGNIVKGWHGKRRRSSIPYTENTNDTKHEIVLYSSLQSMQGNEGSVSSVTSTDIYRPSASPPTSSADARCSAPPAATAGSEDDLTLPSQAISAFADVQYPITMIITENDD